MDFDQKILQNFINLIDRIIAIAQERIKLQAQGNADPAPPKALEFLVEGLQKKRERALSGMLPPSEGRVGIGVLRALDWAEDPNSPLAVAADDLETYYLEKMK